jgi:hypothetical protein
MVGSKAKSIRSNLEGDCAIRELRRRSPDWMEQTTQRDDHTVVSAFLHFHFGSKPFKHRVFDVGSDFLMLPL